MQERTIEILKNFASINQGLVFKKGSRLRTINHLQNVFAVAEVPDQFPRDFAIYDLNELLSVLSLFQKPEITYNENEMVIQSGKTKVRYVYSSPTVVVSPPAHDIVLTNPSLTFILSEADFIRIQKSAAALKLKELSVSSGKIRAYNKASTGNQVVIDVDTAGDSAAPERVVKIENLNLIQGDYKVEVFDMAMRFESIKDPTLVYTVAVETE